VLNYVGVGIPDAKKEVLTAVKEVAAAEVDE
jgi:hypothetical protein